MVRRGGRVFIWSRGEELITERFPDLAEPAALLPEGTVLDGEILPWRDGPLPFAQLQRRIGRKQLGPGILAEVPVVLLAYDLLELAGMDLREQPLADRRARLAALLRGTPAAGRFPLSPALAVPDWDAAREGYRSARAQGAEGLMLKRLDSAYGVGRRKGAWWKWKVAPFTVDAVLMYAQRGHGRRSSFYSDYTFGVWSGPDEAPELVPVGKAYFGFTDEELRELDRFVRNNTVERFGPVRAVRAEPGHGLVLEVAFEGLNRSTRHRSGIAMRFPRISRLRWDKPPAEADRLETLEKLLPEGA